MRALVVGIAGSLVGAGCFIEQVNTNYCSNINGDTFCEQRHGEQRPYCVFGSGPCLDGLPAEQNDDPSFDGCVTNEPVSECYSPCGGGQAKEDLDTCLDDEETTDSSGVGTTSTGSVMESTGGSTSESSADGTSSSSSSGASTGGCDNGMPAEGEECTICGNGMLEGEEVCDGEELNGESCESQGYSGGKLQCDNGNCLRFDTSGCHGKRCSDDGMGGCESSSSTDVSRR